MPDVSAMPFWDSCQVLTDQSYSPHAAVRPRWWPPGMEPDDDASSDEDTYFKLYEPRPSTREDLDQWMDHDRTEHMPKLKRIDHKACDNTRDPSVTKIALWFEGPGKNKRRSKASLGYRRERKRMTKEEKRELDDRIGRWRDRSPISADPDRPKRLRSTRVAPFEQVRPRWREQQSASSAPGHKSTFGGGCNTERDSSDDSAPPWSRRKRPTRADAMNEMAFMKAQRKREEEEMNMRRNSSCSSQQMPTYGARAPRAPAGPVYYKYERAASPSPSPPPPPRKKTIVRAENKWGARKGTRRQW